MDANSKNYGDNIEPQKENEAHGEQFELFSKLTRQGTLKPPRKGNYYQAIEQRARQMGLSLSHGQIYSLARILNRGEFLSHSSETTVDNNEPKTWIGARKTVWDQINTLFTQEVLNSPQNIQPDANLTVQINSKLHHLDPQERNLVLKTLAKVHSAAKLKFEVSDQDFRLSYYDASNIKQLIGRPERYSQEPITQAPRTAQQNLEKAWLEFSEMPVNAKDTTRAQRFRTLVRSFAATQSGNKIDWKNLNVNGKSLSDLVSECGMHLKIEGSTDNEKLVLFAPPGTPPSRLIFETYSMDIGVGNLSNQPRFRGLNLAEGLRMSQIDTSGSQASLLALRHIAAALRTAEAADYKTYKELFAGVKEGLRRSNPAQDISILDNELILLTEGREVPGVKVPLEIKSAQDNKTGDTRLQNLIKNPEKSRMLRKAIENLAEASDPRTKIEAVAILLQEGLSGVSFQNKGSTYSFNFETSMLSGNLKNVVLKFEGAEIANPIVLAKGIVSIRGKNVRVESATAA